MSDSLTSSSKSGERTLDDLVFVGFNSQALALDRYTGEVVWDWKAPKGRASYVAVLLDGDRLIVSVQGYVYCLDPIFGQEVWDNPLKGFGLGIPCLASARGHTEGGGAGAAEAQRQQAAAASGAAAGGAAT
ncbi:MAG: PQQ-binding-like beta-propeller repeat protein [Phycisphaerales bacterium]|nr:MAG: PQQ-binding-like beta-propeller repeat protein [Phycisphaerales bacterium]